MTDQSLPLHPANRAAQEAAKIEARMRVLLQRAIKAEARSARLEKVLLQCLDYFDDPMHPSDVAVRKVAEIRAVLGETL